MADIQNDNLHVDTTERSPNELLLTAAGRAWFLRLRMKVANIPQKIILESLFNGVTHKATGIRQACYRYMDGSVLGLWDNRAFIFDCTGDLENYVADSNLDETHVAARILERCFEVGYQQDHDSDPGDGDHESALASAGFGTDEDYGDFGGEGL